MILLQSRSISPDPTYVKGYFGNLLPMVLKSSQNVLPRRLYTPWLSRCAWLFRYTSYNKVQCPILSSSCEENADTMLILAAAVQPPLTNLYLSLAFGVGQVIIGVAMALFVTRKRRWQKMTHALLAFIGLWFACSGITELIVSGAEVLARTTHTLSLASASHLRAQADEAFLIASLMLLTIGAAYLLSIRLWFNRQLSKSARSTTEKAGRTAEVSSKPEDAQAAEAER